MSFSTEKGRLFLGSLFGKTTTFLMEGRQANLGFARTVVEIVARESSSCAVLDLDALYSSNADSVFTWDGLPEGSTVRVPPPGADIEAELSEIFRAPQRVVIIDSLNTLYHLLSVEDGSSKNRRLAFAVASLSYFSKNNAKAVFLSMYKRERFGRAGSGRAISWLSDITTSVSLLGSELVLTVERGQAWSGGELSTRIPSG